MKHSRDNATYYFFYVVLAFSLTAFSNPKNDLQIITIKNIIKPTLLRCYGQMPDPFLVTINGQIIEYEKEYSITTRDNILNVKYEYSFLKGIYKGIREVIFELDPEKIEYTLNFSWDKKHEPWRIIIPGAIPKQKKLVANNS